MKNHLFKVAIKATIIGFFATIPFFVSSQESTETKIKEYFFTPLSFSPINVSITKKQQLKNNTFFKIGLVNLSTYRESQIPYSHNYFPTSLTYFTAGIRFGLEFRNSITDKFTFFHGPNVNLRYGATIRKVANPAIPERERRSVSQNYAIGIPYTLGFLFNLNSHFLLTAELNPEISVFYNINDFGPGSNINHKIFTTKFGFSNQFGILSIGYRI